MKAVFSLLAVASIGACSSPKLPVVADDQLDAMRRERPLAVLFSIPGCRWCDIAERGMTGAAQILGPAVDFRKVFVDPENHRRLTARYELAPSMPQARLLLPAGGWRVLPLTREREVVAAAIRSHLERAPRRAARARSDAQEEPQTARKPPEAPSRGPPASSPGWEPRR